MPIQKLRRFLGERSRPWQMTDISKPFSVLLKAIPRDVRVLVLEVMFCKPQLLLQCHNSSVSPPVDCVLPRWKPRNM